MGKRLLVISYWGINDVLTQAAVLPHIELLQQIAGVSEIILITIEREGEATKKPYPLSSQVRHYTLRSKNYRINILDKIMDFLSFPKQLCQIIEKEKVDAVLASGALAGALALKAWEKTNVPFYVIFEPHAAYMLENKVWHKWDPRYLFQKKWEEEQVKAASGLIVVSEKYRLCLLNSTNASSISRVLTVRNPVKQTLFEFSKRDRGSIRHQLAISSQVTLGIYVGKYGGLYYKEEAFEIYQKCFELIPDFRLLILSPQPEHEILDQMQRHQLDTTKVIITSVPHHDVPAYLSAADFAFATIKSYPSAKYCSPVKIGEYWASGLPVLLTEGVGDDSDIIQHEGGGALFNPAEPGSIERAIKDIQEIMQNPQHRQEIPELARKYRSPDKLREAYNYFFGNQEEELL